MQDKSIEDDILFNEYVDHGENMTYENEGVNLGDDGHDSATDFGEMDIGNSGNNLNEHKVSDWEGDGFNPVESYEPTFELRFLVQK